MKGYMPAFPQKGDLGITNNYKGITPTAKATKVYNALILKRIRPEIKKILRKSHNGFRKKTFHKLTDSDNPSNYRRSTDKKSQRNTTIRRLSKCYLHMVSPKKLVLL